MPSPSVSTTTSANPGLFANNRNANRMSCQIFSTRASNPPLAGGSIQGTTGSTSSFRPMQCTATRPPARPTCTSGILLIPQWLASGERNSLSLVFASGTTLLQNRPSGEEPVIPNPGPAIGRPRVRNLLSRTKSRSLVRRGGLGMTLVPFSVLQPAANPRG